jgi:hypothetical protein
MIVLVVLAGGALAAAASGRISDRAGGDHRGSPPSALRPGMTTSPNWSGYVATAPPGKTISYQRVSGTWTVPAAVCAPGKPETYSTVWVGLGGYTQTRQEEVGTDANCTASGQPRYFAWFELVPYLSYPVSIANKVAAGDTITGVVRIVNPKLVELQLTNRTRRWTFTRRINWAINDTSTADWIVEAPAICRETTCSEASLSDFRTVTMRDISATGNGETGTLADPHWKVIPIRLVPARMTVPVIDPVAISSGHRGKQGQAASPAGATPSSPSPDGRSFSWQWVKVATHGI